MAAEIHSRPQTARPVLLNKIEGHSDAVTGAVLIPKEDGVITVSEDSTGPASTTQSHEFLISEDFNKMNHVKTYPAHQNRVSDMVFSLETEWVVSTGHDKSMSWMCTQSGSMLGRHCFNAWASCLQYPSPAGLESSVRPRNAARLCRRLLGTDHAAEAGEADVLHHHDAKRPRRQCWGPVVGSSPEAAVLRGLRSQHHHVGYRRKERTDATAAGTSRARSGFALPSVNPAAAVLLGRWRDSGVEHGHTERRGQLRASSLASVCFYYAYLIVLACLQAPQWLDSDSCQKCEQPFFWNIKQMWDSKTLGLRQHHCRKCGKAVCGKCSSKRSTYPIMGFEFPVRMCDACFETIKEEDRTALATFHEGKHNISRMDMDPSRGLMVTCGSDRIVKIWDMTQVVGCSLATGFSS
ncbi:unnamed protein product, partial [Tetraodon nigroviridis]